MTDLLPPPHGAANARCSAAHREASAGFSAIPIAGPVATPAELSEIISKGHPGVRVGRNQPPEPETWSSPVIGLLYIDGDIVARYG